MQRIGIFGFFCLLWTQFVQAQTPLDSLANDAWVQDSLRQDSLRQLDEIYRPLGDTTSVWVHQWGDLERQHIDTTLNDFEYQYVLKQRRFEWRDLGNHGSAHFPLIYQAQRRAGFRVGLHQYDLYKRNREDLLYYQSAKPFSALTYTQATQRNAFAQAVLAQQVSPTFYYGIHYDLINFFGFYDNQQARNQNTDVVLRYTAPKRRYEAHFQFLHHAVLNNNNGGVTPLEAEALRQASTPFLEAVAVSSNSARTEYRHTEFHFTQYWQPGSDSSRLGSRRFEHRLSYQRHRYKFFDGSPAADSSFYGNFQTNNRGVRHYVRDYVLENEVGITQAFGSSLSHAPLQLRGFARYSMHFLTQEPLARMQRQNVFVGGTLRSRSNFPVTLFAQGEIGLLDNAGDTWVEGRLGWQLKDWAAIETRATFQRYAPSLLEERFFVSQAEVWKNNFVKTTTSSLEASLASPRLGFRLSGHLHVMDKLIYYDTAALPIQASEAASIVQFALEQKFSLGAFHLDNQAVWQRVLSGETFMRLPTWYLRHKLYANARIFKTIKLRIGANVQWNSAYQANSYFPLTGQFHVQNRQTLNFYPVVDAYISARVWQLRFFLNAENLSQVALQETYFNAPNYPRPNLVIRLGVRWIIFD